MGRRKREKGVWTVVGIAVVATGLLVGLSVLSVGGGRAARTIADTDRGAKRNVLGSDSAPVTLVEYGDYLCPHCANAQEVVEPELEPLIKEGKVKFVFLHRWLGNPEAKRAAEAVECAADQDRFWAYHGALFAAQTGGFSDDKLKQLAKNVGLDTQTFGQCLDSGKYSQYVLDQTEAAKAKGVDGTPMFFLNDEYLQLKASFSEVTDAVKKELGL